MKSPDRLWAHARETFHQSCTHHYTNVHRSTFSLHPHPEREKERNCTCPLHHRALRHISSAPPRREREREKLHTPLHQRSTRMLMFSVNRLEREYQGE